MLNGQQQGIRLLSGVRVLDLSDEKGLLCGKILGDLGADVIKIERPDGDAARQIGPFYGELPDPERSLFWFAFNTNKRSITLNIETADGKQIFRRLVERAHFVIESSPPGYMEKLGLGYEALSRVNSRIIVVSITAFGQTGPYSNFKGSDLVCAAMGGMMSTIGEPDRPPLRVGPPHVYLHAAAHGAMGAMIAHYHREIPGEGQHVDVSAQHSLILIQSEGITSWDMQREILSRSSPFRIRSSTKGLIRIRIVWPCKDGHVVYTIYGGVLGATRNRAMVEWMDSERMASDSLKKIDWKIFDLSQVSPEEMDTIQEEIGKFLVLHTRADLYKGAVERDIMLVPVATAEDVSGDRQLADRAYWIEMEHPELDAPLVYPGLWTKTNQPLWTAWRRAPLVGEHNQEVYEKELGLSKEELCTLKESHVI